MDGVSQQLGEPLAARQQGFGLILCILQGVEEYLTGGDLLLQPWGRFSGCLFSLLGPLGPFLRCCWW